jgi:hypothetical protein
MEYYNINGRLIFGCKKGFASGGLTTLTIFAFEKSSSFLAKISRVSAEDYLFRRRFYEITPLTAQFQKNSPSTNPLNSAVSHWGGYSHLPSPSFWSFSSLKWPIRSRDQLPSTETFRAQWRSLFRSLAGPLLAVRWVLQAYLSPLQS